MGGYDLKKITGEIRIRFAKESEPFLALGERQAIQAQTNQVVYSDDERLICWLWNHKDSAATCIDENSEYVIFFIDSFDQGKVQAALELLAQHLEKIQCAPLEKGILNRDQARANLNLENVDAPGI